jgi:hypothetical protein
VDDYNIDDATSLAQALIYATRENMRVFPVRADKTPLTPRGFKDASTGPDAIIAMWELYPGADIGYALDADIVVVDVDHKPGRNGFEQFRALAGVSVDDVLTPQATTPSGGRHLYFATLARRYNNNRVPGTTAIDLKTIGGYVVLPAPGNGRRWLKPLREIPLLPAPSWLDCALRREPLVVAPRSEFVSPAPDDPWARKQALVALGKACAKVAAALPGSRENIRHQQCSFVGGLVGRGDLDYGTAFDALLGAARAVGHFPPWRNLEERVARSIVAGMEQPLPLSKVDLLMRNLRSRMRMRRPAS